MPITIEAPQIKSNETPREVIRQDFKSVDDLPIKGGWGYSIEDSVIIGKDDPSQPKVDAIELFYIEKIFVEKRIYEELIIFRDRDDLYSGISWDLLKQELYTLNNRSYDILTFEVKALPDKDWEMLKSQWESDYYSPTFDKELHLEKHNALSVSYITKYYFDITDVA